MTPPKFRAWHIKDSSMFDVNLWMRHDTGSVVIGGTAGDKRYHCVNLPDREPEVIVMQFTSFKDTDGTEIYEGDILRGTGIDGKVRTWVAAPLTSFHHWQETQDLIEEHGDIEVIGNRHQNPDLLHPSGSINAARIKHGFPPIANP